MRHFFFIILTTILVSACGVGHNAPTNKENVENNAQNRAVKSLKILNVETDLANTKAAGEHDESVDGFETFFRRFCNDSIYQFSHIQFPLEYRDYEPEFGDGIDIIGGTFNTTLISRGRWRYINFLSPKDAHGNERVTLVRPIENDTLCVGWTVVDTGILSELHFVYTSEGWRLVRLDDVSD